MPPESYVPILVALSALCAWWYAGRISKRRRYEGLARFGRWGRDVASEIAREAEANARVSLVKWGVAGVLGAAGIVTGGVVGSQLVANMSPTIWQFKVGGVGTTKELSSQADGISSATSTFTATQSYFPCDWPTTGTAESALVDCDPYTDFSFVELNALGALSVTTACPPNWPTANCYLVTCRDGGDTRCNAGWVVIDSTADILPRMTANDTIYYSVVTAAGSGFNDPNESHSWEIARCPGCANEADLFIDHRRLGPGWWPRIRFLHATNPDNAYCPGGGCNSGGSPDTLDLDTPYIFEIGITSPSTGNIKPIGAWLCEIDGTVIADSTQWFSAGFQHNILSSSTTPMLIPSGQAWRDMHIGHNGSEPGSANDGEDWLVWGQLRIGPVRQTTCGV